MKLPVSPLQAQELSRDPRVLDVLFAVGRDLTAAGFARPVPYPAELHSASPTFVRTSTSYVVNAHASRGPVMLRHLVALASCLLSLSHWSQEQRDWLGAIVLSSMHLPHRRLALVTPLDADIAFDEARARPCWSSTRLLLALLAHGVLWSELVIGVTVRLEDKQLYVDDRILAPDAELHADRWLRAWLRDVPGQSMAIQGTAHQRKVLDGLLTEAPGLADVGPAGITTSTQMRWTARALAA